MKRKLLGDNEAKISTRGISNLKRFNIIRRLFEEIVLFIFTGLFNTTEIIKRIDDDIDWDDEDNCSILIEEFNISYIIL